MKISFFIYCFLFVAAAAFTSFPQAASAAGFGVSPSNIDFIVEKGSLSSRQLILYNTGPAARFTAVSEDPVIAVEPGSGALGEGSKAAIRVTAIGKKPGKSASELLISLVQSSENLDSEVKLSLGTRVGVSLMVIESAVHSANIFVGMLTSAGIIMSGLLAYFALRRKNAWLLPAKA